MLQELPVMSRGIYMRNPAFRWVVGLFLLCLVACSSDGPSNLRDGTAKSVLQEAWKEELRVFKLGSIQFRRGNSSGPGYDMLSSYPRYRALANKGLLKLENDRDLSGNFTGWNDFFALTQSGVQRTSTVVLTPEGAKIGTVHQVANTEGKFVTFIFGGYRIEKIVSNEAVDMNGDKYRVVLGTHVFEVRPEFLDVMTQAGEPTFRDRRFRALLKYDAFDSKWKLQISDVGPRDVDFQSQNVPTRLAQLRLTGAR